MGRLAEELKHMQYELIQIVRSVSGSAGKIYARTSEIAAGNSALSTRSEQQVAALEETAASMEELTITVKQNANMLLRQINWLILHQKLLGKEDKLSLM